MIRVEEKHLYRGFRKNLMRWHESIDRNLPWKQTDDPYKIWLSEIILQQTRVDQGTAYYLRIIKQYPTVQHLANASQDDVLAMWKGLGYYARARNMHTAAKQIVNDFSGSFPSNYDDIKSLKGVGDYTAAAIASFAFHLPFAVVDGNVFRVLSRYFGVDTPIDTSAGKKLFDELAQECLDQKKPAEYNQSIMDFGALVCKFALPMCDTCPLSGSCRAFNQGIIDLLPIKSKKVKVKNRYFHYLIMKKDGHIFLQKRLKKDIWQGLYQPPMIEGARTLSKKELLVEIELRYNVKVKIKKVHEVKQRLTHRLVKGVFYEIQGNLDLKEGQWISEANINKLGLPLIVVTFLKEHLLI